MSADREQRARDAVVKIGVLHRTARSGTHFIQSVDVLPLPIHGTLNVYARLAAIQKKEKRRVR